MLENIKGITKLRLEKLKKLNIETIYDLLCYKPKSYINMDDIKHISDVQNGLIICKVKIIDKPSTRYIKKNMNITQLKVSDGITNISCYWFNQPYICKKDFDLDKEYIILGNITINNGVKRFVNPTISTTQETLKGIIPVYGLTKGMNQKTLRMLIKNTIEYCKSNNYFPNTFDYIYPAFENIHFPKNYEKLDYYLDYLKMFEAKCLSCAINYISKDEMKANSISISKNNKQDFINSLPYNLTNSQQLAIKEIENDLKSDSYMKRLLQGDVGCGKTIVSLYCVYINSLNKFQSVYICPTLVLALQTYEVAKSVLEHFGIKVALFTSNTKNKEEILNQIKDGKIDLIIGTHALLVREIEFKNLNLFISDEQHRFGVKQRSIFKQCHSLIMSATPIPRTLSLYAFNNLNLTRIKEKPKGRLEVKTHIIYPNKKQDMLKFIYEECKKGKQAYIVCPLIESNEENNKSVLNLYNLYSSFFKDLKVEIMHGKLKNIDKEKIITEFRHGNIDVLISTTVVEVGVDAKNATIMVIENSEKFGLSTLHQLRGRVGRNNMQSYCFACVNEQANERLKFFKENNDGFDISVFDLQNRGIGEFIGYNQHGNSFLVFLDPFKDKELIKSSNDYIKSIEGSIEYFDLLCFIKTIYKNKIYDVSVN